MENIKSMRVRPVLVENKENFRILTPYGIESKIIIDDNNYIIFLISLDEYPSIGDLYYDEHERIVLIATKSSDHKVYLYKKNNY